MNEAQALAAARYQFDLLCAEGIKPFETVPITSSSFNLALSDPFGFYLYNILGLTGFMQQEADPLLQGSWFHKNLELYLLDDASRHEALIPILNKRIAHLKAKAELAGLDHSSFVEEERRNFQLAKAWYDATSKLIIPEQSLGRGVTFLEMLKHPAMTHIGSEVTWFLRRKNPKAPAIGRFDLLLFNKETKQLWIVDAKTCSESPSVRSTALPIDFQTQHYLWAAKTLLERGFFHEKFPWLPSDISIGGMTHLIVQKPTIKFDKRVDRPFTFYRHILKSGPRKGQSEMRKEYQSDEPSYDLYVERVGRWYRAEGEYESEGPDRILCSPVLLSYNGATGVLDEAGLAEYNSRIEIIEELIARFPAPCNFVRNARNITSHDSVSPMAPFYLFPPHHWAGFVGQLRLVQTQRYGDVTHLKEGLHFDAV